MSLKSLKKALNIILSYFPTALPVGMTQYEAWLDSIVELTGPIADELSLKWVISNEIMRLAPGRDRVPKAFFVKSLRKYAANQIAAVKVLELKQQQETLSKQAEETAKKAVQSVEG